MEQSGKIPPKIAWHEVFDQYYKMKIYNEKTGRGDANARDLLIDLVEIMREQKSDRLLRSFIRTNQKLRFQIDDIAKTSAFVKLKDNNILQEITSTQEIKFTYDRFFEYLLAKNILMKIFDSDQCLHLINESETFGSLKGAIETALVIEKRFDIIHKLANQDTPIVRNILIGALTSLAIQDSNMTTPFLKEILKSELESEKRLAVLSAIEIRPIPVSILEDALKDENPSISRLATQCAYLLWLKNREEGEKLARQIATIGLQDLLKPALFTSLALQERIFLNHFNEPDAIRLINELGLERVKIGKLRSVVLNKIIIYIGVELAERMATSWWWNYKDWVYPVFSTSDEYRKSAKNILKYLDPSQKLNEESKKDIFIISSGPLAGLAHLILIFQVKENPENILPLIRDLIMSGDDKQILVGLKGLAYGYRYHDIREDIETVQKLIFQNPSYNYRLCDFGMNFSYRKSGEIEFITSIIKRAINEEKFKTLIDSILILGDIGIQFPENSLLSLENAFTITNIEVRGALLQSLAKIRVFYPDKVDNFLWKQYRDFLGKIPPLEVKQIPIEIFNVIEFTQYLFQKMPEMRLLLIEMLKKWINMKNRADFRNVIRFCIKISIDAWLKEDNMDKYLRHAKEDSLRSRI